MIIVMHFEFMGLLVVGNSNKQNILLNMKNIIFFIVITIIIDLSSFR